MRIVETTGLGAPSEFGRGKAISQAPPANSHASAGLTQTEIDLVLTGPYSLTWAASVRRDHRRWLFDCRVAVLVSHQMCTSALPQTLRTRHANPSDLGDEDIPLPCALEFSAPDRGQSPDAKNPGKPLRPFSPCQSLKSTHCSRRISISICDRSNFGSLQPADKPA